MSVRSTTSYNAKDSMLLDAKERVGAALANKGEKASCLAFIAAWCRKLKASITPLKGKDRELFVNNIVDLYKKNENKSDGIGTITDKKEFLGYVLTGLKANHVKERVSLLAEIDRKIGGGVFKAYQGPDGKIGGPETKPEGNQGSQPPSSLKYSV